MKNRLCLLACLCFLFSGLVHAQFTPGQKLLGGQLNLSTNHFDAVNSPGSDQKSNTVGMSFTLSKFKSPLSLIGFGVQYNYTDARYNSGSTNPYENRYQSMGAFVELTKLQPLARKLYLAFTGTGGANYNLNDNFNTNNTKSETKGYTVYVNGGMGIWYQLTNRFLLIGNVSNLLTLSYGHGTSTTYLANNTSVTEGRNNSFILNTGLSNFSFGNIGFGVRFLLK